MGTVGGNLLLDTRCNYYDQNYEWRKAIDFCMKKDGKICWVAPSSPRCWAVQSSDLAPVMVALEATVTLAGPDGTREIPAEALYKDDGMDFLTKQPDELLVSVKVPALGASRASYRKLRRRGSFDFPVLGVAARVTMDGGTVKDARIVLGAVGSYPKLCTEAMETAGREVTHRRGAGRDGPRRREAGEAAGQYGFHDSLAEGDGAGARAKNGAGLRDLTPNPLSMNGEGAFLTSPLSIYGEGARG